jgi:hypothetical protein
LSLYKFYKENFKKGDEEFSLEDINARSEVKSSIRKRVHLKMYKDFLVKLHK